MTTPGAVPWDRGNEPMRLLHERAWAGDAEALRIFRVHLRMTEFAWRGVWLIYAGRILAPDQRVPVGRRP